MGSFLNIIARQIVKHGNTDDICVIFPNKRTGVFFRKCYSEIYGQVTWAPDVYTLDSFVSKISKVQIADKLVLINDLYSVFSSYDKLPEILKDSFSSFERFYPLGEIILNDINELDKNLIDISSVYSSMKDVYEIDYQFDYLSEEHQELLKEFWINFSNSKVSKEKERYIAIWDILPDVYKKFSNKLRKNRYGHIGFLYRIISSLIDGEELKIRNYKKIIFAGFNELSKGQIKLFKHLALNKLAYFYWDTNPYYLNDERQESGYFLRKYKNLFKDNSIFVKSPDITNSPKKKITLLSVPQEVGQAKIIPKILEKFSVDYTNEKEIGNTTIVLANEALLFPTLFAIPEEIEKVNITMGYPFRSTLLFSLLSKYFDTQANLRINNASEKLFYKDVLSLLRHPLVFDINTQTVKAAIDKIVKENTIYVPLSDIVDTNTISQPLFTRVSNSYEILTQILSILYKIYSNNRALAKDDKHSLDDEYIYHAYIRIKRFSELVDIKQIKSELSVEMMIKLVRQILASISVPFSGEPLEGLQIMGMIETQNLDFKNVIILGANEGFLPRPTNTQSFITESQRRALGLHTITDNDSIYAHLLYRLLQRAENVAIVYNSITGYNQSGEMSRFMRQIQYESGWNIEQLLVNQNLELLAPTPIIIKKTDSVIRSLYRYFVRNNQSTKKFSASSIITYIECSLRFYFRYVAEIKSAEEVEEEVSAITFGNLLHSSLDYLYSEQIKTKGNRLFKTEDFVKMRGFIELAVSKAFDIEYRKKKEESYKLSGNQLIIREVIISYVSKLLEIDKKYAPFEIVSLEKSKNYSSRISINAFGQLKEVDIQGIMDRIDVKNGLYRIVDYKTGSAKNSFNSIDQLFESESISGVRAVFQLFLYSWLFGEQNSSGSPRIEPSIFAIRKIFSENFDWGVFQKVSRQSVRISGSHFNNIIEPFVSNITIKLEEIFNRELPFEQTETEASCEYCEYKYICNR